MEVEKNIKSDLISFISTDSHNLFYTQDIEGGNYHRDEFLFVSFI